MSDANTKGTASGLLLWHYLKAEHNQSSPGYEKLYTGAGLGIATLPSTIKAVVSHYFLCDIDQKLTPWQTLRAQQVWFEDHVQ